MDVVGDIMTKRVITCTPQDTILEIQQFMIKHRISRIVVTDMKKKPGGIVTQKDIVSFLLTDTSKRGIEEIPAKEVMSKNLVTVKPIAPISDAAKTMIGNKISSLVVVDDDGILKGIATKADIGLYFASKGAGIYSVRDFMTADPISVNKDADLADAAKLMTKHSVSGLPVINNARELVGIITKSDLTRAVASLKK